MRTFVPLGNNVLVEPVVVSDKIGEGHLFKATAYKEPSGEAVVIAVGPGRPDFTTGKLNKPSVEPGDHVVFLWINGRDMPMGGRDFKLLDADQILGKFEGERKNYAKTELLQRDMPGQRVQPGAQNHPAGQEAVRGQENHAQDAAQPAQAGSEVAVNHAQRESIVESVLNSKLWGVK
jgi:co-chaperonin GroES (HSP10)